jgi:pantetheine-phosphate adenylyltransferase
MKGATVAVFPGSFDPLTNGHVDIIFRALAIFEKVVVGVVANPSKGPVFSVEQRVALIQEHFQEWGERIEVGSFNGLLVEYVRTVGTNVVIRGLRAISDFDYEAQMALVNKKLSADLETLFLVAREENSYISSTLVKQIAPLGGDVSGMVPKAVERALRERFGT